jgi:hypothetical protein
MNDFQLEKLKLQSKGGLQMTFRMAMAESGEEMSSTIKCPAGLSQEFTDTLDKLTVHLLRMNHVGGFGIFFTDLAKAEKKMGDAVKKLLEWTVFESLKLVYNKDGIQTGVQVFGSMRSFLQGEDVQIQTPVISLLNDSYGEHGRELTEVVKKIERLCEEYTTQKVFVQLELFGE